jgi:hypothetical protein
LQTNRKRGIFQLFTDDDEPKEENKGKHSIFSFFDDIANLKEGIYVWDEKAGEWVYHKSK